MANVVELFSIHREILQDLADELEDSLHMIAHDELGDRIEQGDLTCLPELRDMLANIVRDYNSFINMPSSDATAEFFVGEAYIHFIDLMKESILKVSGRCKNCEQTCVPCNNSRGNAAEDAANIIYEYLNFPEPQNATDWIDLYQSSLDWGHLPRSMQERLLNEATSNLDSMATGECPKLL